MYGSKSSDVILCPQVTGETINPKPQNPHKTVGTLGKQETNGTQVIRRGYWEKEGFYLERDR